MKEFPKNHSTSNIQQIDIQIKTKAWMIIWCKTIAVSYNYKILRIANHFMIFGEFFHCSYWYHYICYDLQLHAYRFLLFWSGPQHHCNTPKQLHEKSTQTVTDSPYWKQTNNTKRNYKKRHNNTYITVKHHPTTWHRLNIKEKLNMTKTYYISWSRLLTKHAQYMFTTLQHHLNDTLNVVLSNIN